MFGKKHLLLTGTIAVIAGILAGALGHWYLAVEMPRDRAMAAAKKQQEEMNRMVRSGEVVSLSQNEITVKVQNSGDPDLVGKEMVFRVDPNTIIQQGSELLNPNRQGEKIEITNYLKKGDRIDVLARDIEGEDRNKVEAAVAVHWMAPSRGQPEKE